MTDAYVLGSVRTPFARYGSSLSHIRTDDLLGMTMKGACERVGMPLDQVEDIVAGGSSLSATINISHAIKAGDLA